MSRVCKHVHGWADKPIYEAAKMKTFTSQNGRGFLYIYASVCVCVYICVYEYMYTQPEATGKNRQIFFVKC